MNEEKRSSVDGRKMKTPGRESIVARRTGVVPALIVGWAFLGEIGITPALLTYRLCSLFEQVLGLSATPQAA